MLTSMTNAASTETVPMRWSDYVVINLETHLRQIREQPLHGNPPL
jgi:hypothetical protein